MINIPQKDYCCGCGACGDICCHNAISFSIDKEGFWYPLVDKSKCTNCSLCEKVCPIVNINIIKKNDLEHSVCYAAEHKNLEVVFDSTSGGIFSALAEITYKEKGYVGGAVFSENFSIKHLISNDKNDLTRLRSSKYAQSNLSGFYKKVKINLDNDENVLVCGCPCQMAALRAFLKNDYENLIIVDFICRGINSPKVFRKYLDSFEERYGSPVVYSKAKSKEYGWRSLTHKVILADGRTYYETGNENNFSKGYLRLNIYCRPSCYECKFKGFPRIADITLGDFWGIEKIDTTLDKNLGTSLVMINSRKGLKYFEKAIQRINFVSVPFEFILDGNPALTKSLNSSVVDRTAFFKDLDNMAFTDIAIKYVKDNKKQLLKKRIRMYLKLLYQIACTTRFRIIPICQLIKYNKIKNILKGNILLPAPYCVIDIKKTAHLNINGVFVLGAKKFKNSKLETRLQVGNGASLIIENDFHISYGSDIEVFSGATLRFGGGINKNSGSNINCTIICAEKIDIGKEISIGRNVTIRDNNGGHYLNRREYRNTRPVIIKDKVWLCEGCTIMSGVNIGEGAIVGAHAFVATDVPSHSLVMGNPASIRDENVLWKY